MNSNTITKRKRRKDGQVVCIDLGLGKRSYARVLHRPLFAFYDKQFYSDECQDMDEIVKSPIAFKVWVMDYVFKDYRWPVVGWMDLEPSLKEQPRFWKQDEYSGEISVYHRIPELAPLYERSSTFEEAEKLECAAVWDPEHVEDRLRDHFAGKPNKWVQQLVPC